MSGIAAAPRGKQIRGPGVRAELRRVPGKGSPWPEPGQAPAGRRDPRSAGIAGASSRLYGRLAPAISLQLMVQRDPVNVKNLSRPCLVPAYRLECAQDVRFLDLIQTLR